MVGLGIVSVDFVFGCSWGMVSQLVGRRLIDFFVGLVVGDPRHYWSCNNQVVNNLLVMSWCRHVDVVTNPSGPKI